MAEYIDRQEAIEAVRHAWEKGLEPSQYIEELPAADIEPASKWISVEDKLPEPRFLAYLNTGEISLQSVSHIVRIGKDTYCFTSGTRARFAEEEHNDHDTGRLAAFAQKLPRITYWMPLPEPPSEYHNG